jgi:hypothetical protein
LPLAGSSAYRSAVEKILYAGWKPDHMAIADFRAALLGPTATALTDAGARGVTVILADDRAVQGLRIARLDPSAVVSLWVDSAVGHVALESILRMLMPRLAGWLALESVPLRNTTHEVRLGERLPGLYTVAFLEKPATLDHATWLSRWQGDHTPIAIETQRTFLYVQNVLVRALTPDAPAWAAIVEEAFPAEAATDPLRFYAASTPAELAIQQQRMVASCERFIDFARFETIPMSTYVVTLPTF